MNDTEPSQTRSISDEKPLRIAFFTNGFPIASETFIALQAAQLIARGHDVRIFSLSNLAPGRDTSTRHVQELLKGRHTSARWPRNPIKRLIKALPASARTARQAGWAKTPILNPLTFRRNWRDLTSVFQADLVAGEKPFDILHCQFAPLAEPVLKLVDAGLLSGKLIVHFRGYDISEVVHDLGPNIYDYIWDRAERVLVVCEPFRTMAEAIGCPPEKIALGRSGIELSSFPFRPPLELGEGPVRLISVGRLVERKGIHTLLEALARLGKAGLDATLTLIGDGEEKARLVRLAHDLGLADTVRFTGFLSHETLAKELQEHHIFVAASQLGPSDGMDGPNNTIKEAMAVGVPVCATNHGGIPDLIEDGVTGTMAREADAEDLASALTRLIAAHEDWPSITRAARRKMEQEYETQKVTDQLLDVYRSVSES